MLIKSCCFRVRVKIGKGFSDESFHERKKKKNRNIYLQLVKKLNWERSKVSSCFIKSFKSRFESLGYVELLHNCRICSMTMLWLVLLSVKHHIDNILTTYWQHQKHTIVVLVMSWGGSFFKYVYVTYVIYVIYFGHLNPPPPHLPLPTHPIPKKERTLRMIPVTFWYDDGMMEWNEVIARHIANLTKL